MDESLLQLLEFAKPHGKNAADLAVQKYRESRDDFREKFTGPMHYAAGAATVIVTNELAKDWIAPLSKKAQRSIIAAVAALTLLVTALAYTWSLLDFHTFSRFLVAFLPGVFALLSTIAKTYKTWAEAEKTLAEARRSEKEAISEAIAMSKNRG